MKTATKSVPRFRVGDWVSYEFGEARVLGQIVEDRGFLGYGGRRLYDIQIDRSQPYPRITVHPEEILEPAPEEVASLGRSRCRKDSIRTTGRAWNLTSGIFARVRRTIGRRLPELRHVADGENNNGYLGYAFVQWKWEPGGDKDVATATVLLEYDPRLRDPRDQPGLLQTLTEQARRLADERFKDRHRKAVIERD